MKERETEIKTPEAIPQQTGSTPEPALSTRTSVDSVLQLQQTIGNQAVQRLIQSVTEEREEDTSQDDTIAQRIEAAAGRGQPLDPNIERRLKEGLRADLSNVRVHTDSNADQLARAVGAVAFTSGQDIFFREGTYNPVSQEGKRLLAHEVTHTVQQAAGPVAGTPALGGVFVSNPSDSFEQAAEQVADGVVAGRPNTAQQMLPLVPPASIRRKAVVQEKGTLFRVVQRQGGKSGSPKATKKSTTNFKQIVPKTYTVDAGTLEEAAQQIEQREEAGETKWNPTYKTTLDENGNVASATVDVEITVTLPKWPGATKLNKAARAEWERFFKALKAHEQRHVNLARQKLKDLAEKLVGKSPADAEESFQKAVDDLQKSSDDYDEISDHGRNEGTIIDTSAGTSP
jgi:predicted secreted Zn-dependent protease